MSLEFQKTQRRIDELEARLVERLDAFDALIATLGSRTSALEVVSQNYRTDILSEAHDSIHGAVAAAVDAAKNELKEVVHQALPTDEAPSDAATVIPVLLAQAPAVEVVEEPAPVTPEAQPEEPAAEAQAEEPVAEAQAEEPAAETDEVVDEETKAVVEAFANEEDA